MYKVFIIEDDTTLSQLIQKTLSENDYEASVIDIVENFEKELILFGPDLILLDINLPYLDGFILCSKIRKITSVPLIIISARNTEAEQIFGLEQGADDYLVKPFSVDMLLTKVNVQIRRAYEIKSIFNTENDRVLKYDNLFLDTHNFTLKYEQTIIDLSKNEYRLIKIFFESQGKIIEREQLMMLIWDQDAFIDENTLNVNIKRVKDKLFQIGFKGNIKSKRGVGYYIEKSHS